jgi:hypothetical protein
MGVAERRAHVPGHHGSGTHVGREGVQFVGSGLSSHFANPEIVAADGFEDPRWLAMAAVPPVLAETSINGGQATRIISRAGVPAGRFIMPGEGTSSGSFIRAPRERRPCRPPMIGWIRAWNYLVRISHDRLTKSQ